VISLGGGALLMAMAIDFVAVTGRFIRIPLLGSIELVQIVVGISGVLAILVATLHQRHARVMLVFSRLSPRIQGLLTRLNALISAMFFLALMSGSCWLLIELWSSFEESELWHIPYRPLRLFITGVLLLVSGVFAGQAIRGSRS
jgi:TRAP-type C4-dicarboxylate transport system permease small subunit